MVDIDPENEADMKFRFVVLQTANLASKSLIRVGYNLLFNTIFKALII